MISSKANGLKHYYNIDDIIKECELKENSEFLNYLCFILKEEKKCIITVLYQNFGKNFLIHYLEEVLKIENSGGILKQNKTNKEIETIGSNINSNKKSLGGIFFALLKQNPEAKEIIKKEQKKENKSNKEMKKVLKSLEKMNFEEK